MSDTKETVDQIIDWVKGKVIDWGQDTPEGMVGVAKLVAIETDSFAQKLALEQGVSKREERLEELLAEMVGGDDTPCSFDHHGYCQEHGWFGDPGECGHREARQLLGYK